MATDLELLAGWRAGDRAAGDALIVRHFDALCRFFRSKLGDDVEDLIQRTFLDLLELDASHANVRGTLFTIAHRRLIDHLRDVYKRPAELVSSLPIADLGTSPSGVLARSEEERLLHQALRQISLEHQVALELAYWEGFSGPEIAAVLQISEHTVRSRLARAREALRAAIEKVARSPALARSTLDAFAARAPD